MEKNSFKCSHCGAPVSRSELMGTKHRNHCPFCLWSRHVDQDISGDRRSRCLGKMEPVGLTFKKEGRDKYGKQKQGELMIAHRCSGCGKISINRVAGDDEVKAILAVFEKSKKISRQQAEELRENQVRLLEEKDRPQLIVQLFGKVLQ